MGSEARNTSVWANKKCAAICFVLTLGVFQYSITLPILHAYS